MKEIPIPFLMIPALITTNILLYSVGTYMYNVVQSPVGKALETYNSIYNADEDEKIYTVENTDIYSDKVKENIEEIQQKFNGKYEVLGSIIIPKIDCEYAILDTLNEETLRIAIAYVYGPGLNEVGNTVLFGHNYKDDTFFSNIQDLKLGDLIYIKDKNGTEITYEIYNKYITDPTDANFFTRDTEGKREISLQTSTDDGEQRIVIWAKEK